MITITQAVPKDILKIQKIAYLTWPATYGKILSKEQLDYMLDMIYSEEALRIEFEKNEQLFYLISKDYTTLGFTAVEHHYKGAAVTRIHKIYLLPETQGKGIGKKVIEKIRKLAMQNQSTSLSLNVNRNNSALDFYKKLGFEITEEVNIAIGNGYLMEDYVMEKRL